MTEEMSERVAGFIDGFSVYYGMLAKNWRHLLWLDYRALMTTLVRPGQELVSVKYFTSLVRKPLDSRERQAAYVDALQAHGGLEIVHGRYEDRPNRCPQCGHKWPRPKEKMTDVNIATHMALDAEDDLFDTAFLLCADSDLAPAVDLVRERTGRKVIVISPPGRTSDYLARRGNAHLHFRKRDFARSQLPETVTDAEGRDFTRPEDWR